MQSSAEPIFVLGFVADEFAVVVAAGAGIGNLHPEVAVAGSLEQHRALGDAALSADSC